MISFNAGVRDGMEKVAAGVAAVIGAEDTTGGNLEPQAEEIRLTRHPSKPERRLVRRQRKKLAENVSQTIDSGNQSQTQGEAGVAGRAGGIGSTNYTSVRAGGHQSRVERKTGNQKTGVPIWLRLNKNLQSQSTRSGGDKAGPMRSDNQFETPPK